MGADVGVSQLSREPVRALHVVSGDLWAGAEVQVVRLLKSLSKMPSTAVAAFALNEGELTRRLRDLGVPTYCADESSHGFVQVVRRLVAAFDEFKPQILHSHRYKEHVLAGALAALRPVRGRVRTVHGAPETRIAAYDLRRLSIRWLDTVSARFEDCCVAVSQDLAARVGPTLRPRRLEVVPNCVDLEEIEQELAGAAVQSKADGVHRVGIVGRLMPVKRVDLFLDVAEAVAARRRDVEFWIVGDGPLRGDLERRIERAGLQRRVRLTGAIQPIAPLMATFDVLMITSDHEGLPSVLLEALALRVPVVARAVGGIPEVVAHGESAVLVQHADVGELAGRVEALLGDPLQRQRYATAGLEVAARYSAPEAARRYRAIYEGILHGR